MSSITIIKAALLLSLTTLLWKLATGATYNCKKGCKLTGPPVCGEDGVTYADECLAVCQDVTVANHGICKGDNAFDRGSSRRLRRAKAPKVSLEKMNRFEGEGYKYVAHRKIQHNDDITPRTIEAATEDDDISSELSEEELKAGLQPVRITSDGDEYVSVRKVELSDEYVFTASAKPGDGVKAHRSLLGVNAAAGAGDKRELFVFGEDDRTRIENTTVWPYRIYGQLTGDGSCSGTVVGPSHVLTAAHCMYSYRFFSDWGYTGMDEFRPGRDGSFEPFPMWKVNYTTLFRGWLATRCPIFEPCPISVFRWDVAILTMKEQNGKKIGEYLGHAGIQSTTPQQMVPNGVRIIGYPAEKAEGTMWLSNECPDGFWKHLDLHPLVLFKCDSTAGSSGSSLMTSAMQATGIATFQTFTSNGGMYFDSNRAKSVKAWINEGTTGVIRQGPSRSECWEVQEGTLHLDMVNCTYEQDQIFHWDKATGQIRSDWKDWKSEHCLTYVNKHVLQFRPCQRSFNQAWLVNSEGKVRSVLNPLDCIEVGLLWRVGPSRAAMRRCSESPRQKFLFPSEFGMF